MARLFGIVPTWHSLRRFPAVARGAHACEASVTRWDALWPAVPTPARLAQPIVTRCGPLRQRLLGFRGPVWPVVTRCARAC